MILFVGLFWFPHDLMQQLPHTENIYHLHFLDYCCFFLFYPVWRSNIWSPRLKFTLWLLYYSSWTELKIRLLPLTDVSKLIWCLEISDSKSSLTTSFTLSYGINSVLSQFEWITRSSSTSLEEIKLIAIVS